MNGLGACRADRAEHSMPDDTKDFGLKFRAATSSLSHLALHTSGLSCLLKERRLILPISQGMENAINLKRSQDVCSTTVYTTQDSFTKCRVRMWKQDAVGNKNIVLPLRHNAQIRPNSTLCVG